MKNPPFLGTSWFFSFWHCQSKLDVAPKLQISSLSWKHDPTKVPDNQELWSWDSGAGFLFNIVTPNVLGRLWFRPFEVKQSWIEDSAACFSLSHSLKTTGPLFKDRRRQWKEEEDEINYIRNKSGWNSNSLSLRRRRRGQHRASSRLRMEIQTGLSITHLFSFAVFENFTLWKTINRVTGFWISNIYTVLNKIFRLPGARGQASLISCCQLLGTRLASATCGGSPTSVTRCQPYLYRSVLTPVYYNPHWTCCYPVFHFSERRRHLPHPVLPDARHHRHPHLPPRAHGWQPFRFQNPLIIPLLSALLSSRHFIRLISLMKLSRSDDICFCWFLLIRLVNILRWDLQWFTNTSPPFSRFSTISSWTINSLDHLLSKGDSFFIIRGLGSPTYLPRALSDFTTTWCWPIFPIFLFV